MNRILFIFIFLFSLTACNPKETYYNHQGFIFGTTYNISYQYARDENLQEELLAELHKFNQSLSNYDPNSIISRINNNDPNVIADSFFIRCFTRSQEISKITNGAFDLTVAPVVNAWGFGFDESMQADSAKIDSLMQFVGYEKVTLENKKIIKDKQSIKLDVSAIAKGYGVDVAAEFFEKNKVKNYMVEIGGEVRAKGVNASGNYWRIGIDKPIENLDVNQRELQDIIELKNKSLATSGNYRQFYEKDGIKYSHTINPKTGYPARSNLLSATVLADNCMTADALATAFMVMGVDKSKALAQQLENIEIYLIFSDSVSVYDTYISPGFKSKDN